MKYFVLTILVLGLSFLSYYGIKKYILKDNNKKIEEKKEIKKEKKEEIYPKISRANMIMTGDALLHTSVYKSVQKDDNTYDFTPQMEYIEPIIKNYDIAFYNQETIIGGKDLGISNYPLFNSPDEIGDCMVDIGFNMVNLASNHSLDKGEKGALYSINFWNEKEDVLTAGAYLSEDDRTTPRIKEVNGIKYTLLSYTTSTNGINYPEGKTYYAVPYSDETAKEDIERVKDQVDVIFVSMHWGVEYSQSPSQEQKRVANYLSELGVNVIIGTHPHVLQPIEYIGDTLVVYSLGNFISGQIGIDKLTGALVSLDITKSVDKDGTKTIKISNVGAELIYTYYKKTTPYWSDFKVIPYGQLNDELLPNYKSYYEKYSNILKQNDNSIQVKSIE